MASYNLYAVWALPNGTFQVVKELAQPSGTNRYTYLPWPVSEVINGLSHVESTAFSYILTDTDWHSLPTGSGLYMGYGTTIEEMVQAKRYSLRFVKN